MKEWCFAWVEDRMAQTEDCDGWQAYDPYDNEVFGPVFKTEEELADYLWPLAAEAMTG